MCQSKNKQAHIWDSHSSTRGTPVSSSKSGKGKQLHLGSFPSATHAAKAYDRAALLLRGRDAALNFPVEEYDNDPLLQVCWGRVRVRRAGGSYVGGKRLTHAAEAAQPPFATC